MAGRNLIFSLKRHLSVMSKPTSREAHADFVQEYFTRFMNLQPGCEPGFDHGLKLSYHTVDVNRMSFGTNSFTYRYRLSNDVPRFTMGLLMALMDDSSSTAIVAVGCPSPSGVSLQMQTELARKDLESFDELDIVNTITKLGKSVSHTRTEFVCPTTKEVVAFSSHVKFMSTGNKKTDKIFSTLDLYKPFVDKLVGDKVPKKFEEQPLWDGMIRPFLKHRGHGRASFKISGEHFNPNCSMHGGCHAMVMEEVALRFAQEELQCTNVTIESMQVDYVAAAKGEVDVICEPIGKVVKQRLDSAGSTIHVRVLIQQGERICSEGKLRISPTSTSTSSRSKM